MESAISVSARESLAWLTLRPLQLTSDTHATTETHTHTLGAIEIFYIYRQCQKAFAR